ncbi:MAG TPA: U32 family peptidase [Burkholderiales bacterium]|nr:U32 family peptidase [Burkholderiales bacterium]
MKLALGPVLYYWPRETVLGFYHSVALAPIDIVYLGETVCSKRHELRFGDWMEVAETLAGSGKEVVLSTQTLIESESDLRTLRRIVDNGRYTVEANDMGAVRLLAGRTAFVAGASLNLYNIESIRFVATLGASRWIPPVEMSSAQLTNLVPQLPAGLETELVVYGRLPLAHSARCFTARRFNLQKDACEFRCMDFPDGLPVNTREDNPLFTFNGVQTQSARVCNLVHALPEIKKVGIDVLRINPLRAHTLPVAELFRRAIERPAELGPIAHELDALTGGPACNGFWHGAAGMQALSPAGSA